MEKDVQSAKDDLAFIRGIVDDSAAGYRDFGFIYMMAGILYGIQCLIIGLDLSGILTLPPIILKTTSWLPTVILLLILSKFIWRDRKNPFGKTSTKRAINAGFSSAGIANVIFVLVFGYASYQRQDFTIWLFYGVVVCTMQGAIWYTASVIRRRLWMGAVAAGWFLSALLLGLFLSNIVIFNWVCVGAMFLFMALPGYIMMRFDSDKV